MGLPFADRVRYPVCPSVPGGTRIRYCARQDPPMNWWAIVRWSLTGHFRFDASRLVAFGGAVEMASRRVFVGGVLR